MVVGIPRSGLLPANIIALYLNIQLTDIDSFVEHRIYGSGFRMKSIESRPIKKVLVVDDSVQSGRAIMEAKRKLKDVENEFEIIYLAPIVTSEGASLVDIHFTIIDEFRLFEWNVFHHKFLSNACLDIDGVLCKDPLLDDDGPIYRNFLETAEPLFVPTVPVKSLISCRLEKYRYLTERWLQNNNVRYEELVLLDLPDKASRVKWGKHAEYKASCYKKSDALLFIESSAKQAEIIAKISRKPVLCIETNCLLDFSFSFYKTKRMIEHRVPKLYYSLKRFLGK